MRCDWQQLLNVSKLSTTEIVCWFERHDDVLFFSSLGKQRTRTSLYDRTFRPLKVQEYQTLVWTRWTSRVFPEVVLSISFVIMKANRPPTDDDSVGREKTNRNDLHTWYNFFPSIEFELMTVAILHRIFFSDGFTIDQNKWPSRISSFSNILTEARSKV